MKKALKKENKKELYFYEDGIKKIVDYKDKFTYPSRLYGNISGLYGDISSRLYGNITGIKGIATNYIGNLDDCELTDEERKIGIDIKDLII